MSGWRRRLRQWFYPPQFRIEVSTDAGSPAFYVSALTELAERLERAAARSTAPPPEEGSHAASAPTESGLRKEFVIDLCNHVHRLGRAAKPFQASGGTDASRLTKNFDQIRKLLTDNGIESVDLTGRAYQTGWSDFEMLGEPQFLPDVKHPIVMQCERPLVKLRGEVIQRAKGIVGRPPI